MAIQKFSEIESFCKEFLIKDYNINSDGSITVNRGGVWLLEKGLTEIPIKFKVVHGQFHCGSNDLTSMENFPDIIHGDFLCFNTKVESFIGGPKAIKGGMDLSYNPELTSFEGFPETISKKTHQTFDATLSPIDEVLTFFDHNLDAVEWINYYDVIDPDDMEISFTKLCAVWDELNQPYLKPENIKYWEKKSRSFKIIMD